MADTGEAPIAVFSKTYGGLGVTEVKVMAPPSTNISRTKLLAAGEITAVGIVPAGAPRLLLAAPVIVGVPVSSQTATKASWGNRVVPAKVSVAVSPACTVRFPIMTLEASPPVELFDARLVHPVGEVGKAGE